MSSINGLGNDQPPLITYIDKSTKKGIETYIDCYENALRVNPENICAKQNLNTLRTNLGLADEYKRICDLIQENKLQEAHTAFLKLKEEHPNYIKLKILEGLYLYRKTDFINALQLFKEFLAETGETESKYWIGASLYQLAISDPHKYYMHLFEAEKALLSHRISPRPQNSNQREIFLASIYKITFRFSRAVLIYEQLLAKKTTFGDFLNYELAFVYLSMNLLDKTARCLSNLSEQFKRKDEYFCIKACYFLKKKDLEGLNAFITSQTTFPNKFMMQFLQNVSLFLQGKEAVPLLLDLDVLRKGKTSAHFNTAFFFDGVIYFTCPLKCPSEIVEELPNCTAPNIALDNLYVMNLFNQERYSEIFKYLELLTVSLQIAEFKSTPDFTPSVAKLYLILALSYYLDNKHEEAEKILQELTKMLSLPRYKIEILNTLNYLRKEGHLEKVILSLQLSHQNAKSFETFLKACEEQEKPAAALTQQAPTIVSGSSNAAQEAIQAKVDIITKLLNANTIDDAKKALLLVLELDKATNGKYENINLLFGKCYFHLNISVKSIEYFKKQIQINNHADARFTLALQYKQLERHPEALELLLDLQNTLPHSFKVKNGLGVVYADMQRLETAINIFKDLLKRYPKNSEVLRNLAICYAYKDELTQTSEYLLEIPDKDKPARVLSLQAFLYLTLVSKNTTPVDLRECLLKELEVFINFHSKILPEISAGLPIILKFITNLNNTESNPYIADVAKIASDNPKSVLNSWLIKIMPGGLNTFPSKKTILNNAISNTALPLQHVNQEYILCLYLEKRHEELIRFTNTKFRCFDLTALQNPQDLTVNAYLSFLYKARAHSALGMHEEAAAIYEVLHKYPNESLQIDVEEYLATAYFSNQSYLKVLTLLKDIYLESAHYSFLYIAALIETLQLKEASEILAKALKTYPKNDLLISLIKKIPKDFRESAANTAKEPKKRTPKARHTANSDNNREPTEAPPNLALRDEEARNRANWEADKAKLEAEQRRVDAKRRGVIVSADIQNRFRTEASDAFVEDDAEELLINKMEELAAPLPSFDELIEKYSMFGESTSPEVSVNAVANYTLFGNSDEPKGSGLFL